MDISNLMLWILVFLLGIQLGAGLYETRVIVPLWSSSPPESVIAYFAQAILPDSGRRFWIFTTPLVGLISLINVILAWFSAGPQGMWRLLGAGGCLAMVIVTFAYFVPILLSLPRAGELPAEEVVTKVRWWVRLNWVRAIILIASWLALLKAFSYGS